ncbi:hypothetical protein D3C75_1131540 [compost metagenome]
MLGQRADHLSGQGAIVQLPGQGGAEGVVGRPGAQAGQGQAQDGDEGGDLAHVHSSAGHARAGART